ncbi:MAG: phosphoribosylformylglycinamidine synthase subunit PurS [Thermoanaerobaculum sp.]|nr:phosphoribosylformylglycinamidine synthase subunit PurS [Thermoanaerobaculum sp.]
MKVEVRVYLKEGVLDPQGEAIRRVLGRLGYQEVQSVRVGKLIFLEVEGEAPDLVLARVSQACQELLANPVIEDFEVRLP